MSEPSEPIALKAYQTLAESYAAIAETKAENGYNEHPAIREQIGDVAGLDVLDAGCGPGFLSRDLLAKGAKSMVGLDISPNMLAIAQKTAGEEAQFIEHDLAQPLPLEDDRFDLVVSSLAIDYVRDWSVPLSEFRRVLRDNGRLVFSVQHPMGSYNWLKPPHAFGVHYCEPLWRGFTKTPVVVPDYYRSMEEMINPIIGAGFHLRALKETRPLEALKTINPKKYHYGSTFPTFLVIDAVPAPSHP